MEKHQGKVIINQWGSRPLTVLYAVVVLGLTPALAAAGSPENHAPCEQKKAELREACEARKMALEELEAARSELAEAAKKLAKIERALVVERVPSLDPTREFIPEPGEPRVIFKTQREYLAEKDGPRLGIMIANTPEGIHVVDVIPGGAADLAGMERGDRIVAINGLTPAPELTIPDILQTLDVGDVAEVAIDRSGATLVLNVTTQAMALPERDFLVRVEEFGDLEVDVDVAELQENLAAMHKELAKAHHMRRSGQRVMAIPGLYALGEGTELTANHHGLAPYFGTGDGVIVLRIAAANPLGLKDGDVVLKVEGETVSKPTDIAHRMLRRGGGDSVNFEIMRNREVTAIEGAVPEENLPRR